jgi:hypothetical protein
MKLVLNRCYGGFSLSRKAVLLGRKLSKNPRWGGPTIKGDVYEKEKKAVPEDYGYVDVPRHDPILVKVVEQLGSKLASGNLAELKVVEIPDGIQYEIDEYDGIEHVAEQHRRWS